MLATSERGFGFSTWEASHNAKKCSQPVAMMQIVVKLLGRDLAGAGNHKRR